MVEACNFADWLWSAAFNRRLAKAPASEDVGEIVADPVWDSFKIRLLPKCDAPKQFRFLRPIAILLASAKLWSKACFQKLSAFDTDRNETHLGFCPGCSCVELVTTTRLVLERRCEWGMTTCMAQLDFAGPTTAFVIPRCSEQCGRGRCRKTWPSLISAKHGGQA